MSICMRCGSKCTCNRHGKVPEELFYMCCKNLNHPPNHKGNCMEHIRKILDEYKILRGKSTMTLSDILAMEADEAIDWLTEHQFDYDLIPTGGES